MMSLQIKRMSRHKNEISFEAIIQIPSPCVAFLIFAFYGPYPIPQLDLLMFTFICAGAIEFVDVLCHSLTRLPIVFPVKSSPARALCPKGIVPQKNYRLVLIRSQGKVDSSRLAIRTALCACRHSLCNTPRR